MKKLVFALAEQDARANKRGMWAVDDCMEPWVWRKK